MALELFGLTSAERGKFYRDFCTDNDVHELVWRFRPEEGTTSQFVVVGDRVMSAGISWQEPTNTFEVHIGMCIGCAPGRVLFIPAGGIIDNRLLGFLIRQNVGTARFGLRTVGEFSYHVSLGVNIVSGSQTSHARRYRALGSPAWLDYQIGSGHGEIYGSYLFTVERWASMERWLDYWLPRTA